MIIKSARTDSQTIGFILSAEAAGPVADSVYEVQIKVYEVQIKRKL